MEKSSFLSDALKAAGRPTCPLCDDLEPARMICSAWHGPLEIGQPGDPRRKKVS